MCFTGHPNTGSHRGHSRDETSVARVATGSRGARSRFARFDYGADK